MEPVKLRRRRYARAVGDVQTRPSLSERAPVEKTDLTGSIQQCFRVGIADCSTHNEMRSKLSTTWKKTGKAGIRTTEANPRRSNIQSSRSRSSRWQTRRVQPHNSHNANHFIV